MVPFISERNRVKTLSISAIISVKCQLTQLIILMLCLLLPILYSTNEQP